MTLGGSRARLFCIIVNSCFIQVSNLSTFPADMKESLVFQAKLAQLAAVILLQASCQPPFSSLFTSRLGTKKRDPFDVDEKFTKFLSKWFLFASLCRPPTSRYCSQHLLPASTIQTLASPFVAHAIFNALRTARHRSPSDSIPTETFPRKILHDAALSPFKPTNVAGIPPNPNPTLSTRSSRPRG